MTGNHKSEADSQFAKPQRRGSGRTHATLNGAGIVLARRNTGPGMW